MYSTEDLIDPLAAPFELSGADDHGVLLIHGLTDSPYSLRRVGQILYERGFYVLGLRLPGHGAHGRCVLDTQGGRGGRRPAHRRPLESVRAPERWRTG